MCVCVCVCVYVFNICMEAQMRPAQLWMQAYTYLAIGASGAPFPHVWGGGSRTRGKGALGVDFGPKQGARERDGVRSWQSSAGKESVARVSEGGEGKGKAGGVGVGRASLVCVTVCVCVCVWGVQP